MRRRAQARFKSQNAFGSNMDAAAANSILSEIMTLFDVCHCRKPAP
jgi:hypothetical protein